MRFDQPQRRSRSDLESSMESASAEEVQRALIDAAHWEEPAWVHERLLVASMASDPRIGAAALTGLGSSRGGGR